MHDKNPVAQRLTDNFERFNIYAREAVEAEQNGNDGTGFAMLAVAFELGQIRYQLATQQVDNRLQRRKH